MTSFNNILVAAAISTVLSLGAAQAADSQLKPLQGASFHAGTKHAIGYFLSDNATCKLVLTLADDTNFVPSRLETAIEAGQSTHYQLSEGKSLDFACLAAGQMMSVSVLDTSAAN